MLPALPTTAADLLRSRANQKPRSLVDQIDDIFVALWDDAAFKKLNFGVGREHTVYGADWIDDVKCIDKIRAKAKEQGRVELAASMDYPMLINKLNVVRKRYNVARQQRATQPVELPVANQAAA